jgi:hypothetical protein
MTAGGLVQKSHNSYKTALGEAVTTGLLTENFPQALTTGALYSPERIFEPSGTSHPDSPGSGTL